MYSCGKTCDSQESESASSIVFQVTGEPFIGINGVPDVTPGGSKPIQLDTISDAESDIEPCFDEWLEGRKVRKMFGDQYYSGKVVKFDKEMKWYRVVYEDGDFEDLEWRELEEVLLPLDISIPLKSLALQICKREKSVTQSGENTTQSRKYHKKVESSQKTMELFQISHVTESENRGLKKTNAHCGRTAERLMRANAHSGRTAQGILNRQRKIRSAQVSELKSEILVNQNVHCKMTAERLMEASENCSSTEPEILKRQRETQIKEQLKLKKKEQRKH